MDADIFVRIVLPSCSVWVCVFRFSFVLFVEWQRMERGVSSRWICTVVHSVYITLSLVPCARLLIYYFVCLFRVFFYSCCFVSVFRAFARYIACIFIHKIFPRNFSFLPFYAPPNSITAHVTPMHLHSLCMNARAPIAVALLLLLVSLFNSVWNVPGNKKILLFAMKMMLANDFLITLCACVLARFTTEKKKNGKKRKEGKRVSKRFLICWKYIYSHSQYGKTTTTGREEENTNKDRQQQQHQLQLNCKFFFILHFNLKFQN